MIDWARKAEEDMEDLPEGYTKIPPMPFIAIDIAMGVINVNAIRKLELYSTGEDDGKVRSG